MTCKHDKNRCIGQFDCPACVCRLLARMPSINAKHWWMRIKKQQGDDFMDKVRIEVEKSE